MNRFRWILLFVVPLLFVESAEGGALKFRGFPTRRLVIVQPPAPIEPAAKLPPPVEPAMERAGSIDPKRLELPPGVEIERTPLRRENEELQNAHATERAEAAAKRERIKAERERLNRNALAWQQERAAAGSAVAMRSLGMRYMAGDGVEKDEAKGMDWLQKAAKAGDPAAKKALEKREQAEPAAVTPK